MASNSSITDRDGDTPDWIEIYNYGAEKVSLDGMYLSDDDDDPQKWQISNIELEANDYLLIWASDKDSDPKFYKTLVAEGDICKYFIPSSNLTIDWITAQYDDSSWPTGPSGFGYGDGDDATVLPSGTRSVYVKKTFTIEDPSSIESLFLDIDYDDGMIAYLNGHFIANRNMVSEDFSGGTPVDHEAEIYQGIAPERIDVSDYIRVLNPGENVLAIQANNINSGSSDLTIIPFLTALYLEPSNDGVDPPRVLDLTTYAFHANFKISSAGENISLYNKEGNLVDKLSTGELPQNVSIGVSDLHNGELRYFETATPRARNESIAYSGYVAGEVMFSHPGGVIDSEITLSMSGATGSEYIKYTTDGTLPDENSLSYQGPISINSNRAVRARIFGPDKIPSKAYSRTFLYQVSHDLPIISLIADPEDFFEEEAGIYSYGNNYNEDLPYYGANFWNDVEVPVNVSFLDRSGNLQYSFDGGTKIFGGWSRANDQRSLSIFARKKYGPGKINYKIFDTRPYDSFNSIVLRNGGNDWTKSNLRDVFMTSLMEGSGLDVQAFQPMACYINGEYWGFYNAREKLNEHFVASKADVDSDDVTFLELRGAAKHGDNAEYLDLYNFIADNNLTEESNYQYVSDRIDIENFIIYNVAQIFAANTDWPGNNIKYWSSIDTKWQWLLFDVDFGFDFPFWSPTDINHNTLAHTLESNGPTWPNPPWSTLILRKLIVNLEFRNAFVNRFADELNSRFLPSNLNTKLDSVTNLVSEEIPKHFERWGSSTWTYNDELRKIRTFSEDRGENVKRHIRNRLNLPAFHKLSLEIKDEDNGSIIINDRLHIRDGDWNGDYFQSVPITVEAVPNIGFVFSHWSGDISSSTELLNVNMLTPMTLQAHFVKDGTAAKDEEQAEPFLVFPNPFSNELTIQFAQSIREKVDINLLDENGQFISLIYSGHIGNDNKVELKNMTDLREGIYILEVKGVNGQVQNTQVVKI